MKPWKKRGAIALKCAGIFTRALVCLCAHLWERERAIERPRAPRQRMSEKESKMPWECLWSRMYNNSIISRVMTWDVSFRPLSLCLMLHSVWGIAGMKWLSLATMAASDGMCLHIRLVAWYVNAARWKGYREIWFIVGSSQPAFPFMLSTIVSTERASCKTPVAFGELNPQRRPMLWKICMFYRVIGSVALLCILCSWHMAPFTFITIKRKCP